MRKPVCKCSTGVHYNKKKKQNKHSDRQLAKKVGFYWAVQLTSGVLCKELVFKSTVVGG